MHRLLHGLTLSLALIIGGALSMPDLATASESSAIRSSCKSKKSRRAKERSRRRRRAKKRARQRRRAKKVTAKTIRRWQKKGLSHAKIVKKAHARGYKVTKRQRRKLKRLRVSKRLIAALSARPAPKATLAAAARGPQPIDINTTIDPNDIDFDSVPPPEGMDMRFADAHRAEGR